jgi:hypothetical protein
LDNWDDDDAAADAPPAPVPTGGGTFQTFACKPGTWPEKTPPRRQEEADDDETEEAEDARAGAECEGAAGGRLRALIGAGVFLRRNETLKVCATHAHAHQGLVVFAFSWRTLQHPFKNGRARSRRRLRRRTELLSAHAKSRLYFIVFYSVCLFRCGRKCRTRPAVWRSFCPKRRTR